MLLFYFTIIFLKNNYFTKYNNSQCIKGFWASFWFDKIGEGLRRLQDKLNDRNFYAFNPSFDKGPAK